MCKVYRDASGEQQHHSQKRRYERPVVLVTGLNSFQCQANLFARYLR